MTADELLPLMREENDRLRAQIAYQDQRIRDLQKQRNTRERVEREQDGAVADLEASMASAR